MKKLCCGLLLWLAGCGTLVPKAQIYGFSETSGSDWLAGPDDLAAEMWRRHNVDFRRVGGTPDVTIEESGPRTGPGIWGRFVMTKIYISPVLHDAPTNLTACVVAHELGHFLGFHHAADAHSLMSPQIVEPDENGNCAWSDSDQAQLELLIEN